jgi:hypothetical protein
LGTYADLNKKNIIVFLKSKRSARPHLLNVLTQIPSWES